MEKVLINHLHVRLSKARDRERERERERQSKKGIDIHSFINTGTSAPKEDGRGDLYYETL